MSEKIKGVFLTLVILGLSFEFSEESVNVFTEDGDPVDPNSLDPKHQAAFSEAKFVAGHTLNFGPDMPWDEFKDQVRAEGVEVVITEEEYNKIQAAYAEHGHEIMNPMLSMLQMLQALETADPATEDQFS